MSGTLISVLVIVGILLTLLALGLRSRRSGYLLDEPSTLEQVNRRHATYLPAIRNALSPVDMDFLVAHGATKVAARLRGERRRVALLYLEHLREDFERLLRLGTMIARLSPRVDSGQELERLKLSLQFWIAFHVVRFGLYTGLSSDRTLEKVSQLVSGLAATMDAALKEMGTRAALPT